MPVVHLDIEVDTQCADVDALRDCLSGWNILYISAILNYQRQEYSARSFVEELGLQGVEWSMEGDDTPGSLYMSLAQFGDVKSLTESGFDQIEGVEVYPVEEDAEDR